MPLEGDSRFKELKKTYAGGKELRGKTLGIIGFGRIGREVAKIALGCGMKVIASDNQVGEADITLDFYDGQQITFAALDTFEDEPSPAIKILMNGNISLSPHIGAATEEAQDRIGVELAEQIVSILKPVN